MADREKDTTQRLRKKRGRPRSGWLDDLVAQTGRSRRSLQLAAERAEKIAPDVLNLVKHTNLDTGAYLDRLKVLGHEEQRAKVTHDLQHGEDKAPRRLTALESAWLNAGDDERAAFLRWIA